MKSKIFFFIIALIIASSILSGCNPFWKNYVNKKYGFSVSLPRLWTIEQGAYKTVVMATSAQDGKDDKFQENINVVAAELPQAVPLEDFFELNKEETLRAIPGEEYNITEKEIYSAGHRAMQLSFVAKVADVTLKSVSAAWVKDKYVYVVSCTSEYATFPKYEPIFNKAIASFRIK